MRLRLAVFGAVLLLVPVGAACSGSNAARQPTATATEGGGNSPAPQTPATPSATAGEPRDTSEPAQLLREGRFREAAEGYAAQAAVATEPLGRARAHLGAGIARHELGDREGAIESLRTAVAAAPVNSVVQRRAAYLLSMRLGEAARHVEAAEMLRPIAQASVSDALQPYIAAEYAKQARRSGNVAAAVAAWGAWLGQPSTPSAVLVDGYRERAAIAKDEGDIAGQRSWLGKLSEATDDPEVRYELAVLAKEAGDSGTFATVLKSIIAASPAAREALLAMADLRDAGYAIDPGQAGLVYYRHGAYVECRKVLLEAIEEPGISVATLQFRLYYLAASYDDAGLSRQAITYYDRAIAADPAGAYAHRARYWAARSAESLAEYRDAAARFEQMVTAGPAGDFTHEAAFRAGYNLLRAGEPADAVALWESLGTTGEARLLYWKGRAQQQFDDEPGAKHSFEAAVSVQPDSFYAGEARRELEQEGPVSVAYRALSGTPGIDWASIEAWLVLHVRGGPREPAPHVAGDLAAMGLRDEAAAEVLRLGNSGGDAWDRLAYIRQAHDLGLSDVAARLATGLLRSEGQDGEYPAALLRLAYPIDYVALLDSESRLNGLDPLFVAALIRQESFWDPTAGSHAGALGLTQVIPPTGEGIAAALGVEDFEPGDLFRPAVSIRFGAYYIGGQVKRYGDPHHALAAYNAGPGNASRWAQAAPAGGRAADFVEVIDIGETHDYVERVMDHYAHYVRAWRD